MEKSQVMLVSFILLIVIIGMTLYLFSQAYIQGRKTGSATYTNLYQDATRLGNELASEGWPSAWTPKTVKKIGITTDDRLDEEKVIELAKLPYSSIKRMAGITNDFIIVFENSSNILSILGKDQDYIGFGASDDISFNQTFSLLQESTDNMALVKRAFNSDHGTVTMTIYSWTDTDADFEVRLEEIKFNNRIVPITDCVQINKSGYYVLDEDLINLTKNQSCIFILADKVVLDGMNNSIIDYNFIGRKYAVYTNKSNVTIKNLNIDIYSDEVVSGIFAESAKNITIDNNSLKVRSATSSVGILMQDINSSKVMDNTITEATVGMVIDYSYINNISSNIVLYGVSPGLKRGILIRGSSYNHFFKNEISFGMQSGFVLNSSKENYFIYNHIDLSDEKSMVCFDREANHYDSNSFETTYRCLHS